MSLSLRVADNDLPSLEKVHAGLPAPSHSPDHNQPCMGGSMDADEGKTTTAVQVQSAFTTIMKHLNM
jgi:hypothetical protein